MYNNFFKQNRFIKKISLILLFLPLFVFSQNLANATSTLPIPLTQDQWVILSFKKIPPNTVSFFDKSLTVKVKSSAGPIVHKLSRVSKVTQFSIRGKFSGAKVKEKTAFDEDSVLRFGLVATGKQVLSGPKKWLAADWVKKLFALAPSGTGLDKIYFYNLTNRSELIGKTRNHPKSDLMVEHIIGQTRIDSDFNITQKMDKPIDIAALWISIDGDDTKSEFETKITEIILTE